MGATRNIIMHAAYHEHVLSGQTDAGMRRMHDTPHEPASTDHLRLATVTGTVTTPPFGGDGHGDEVETSETLAFDALASKRHYKTACAKLHHYDFDLKAWDCPTALLVHAVYAAILANSSSDGIFDTHMAIVGLTLIMTMLAPLSNGKIHGLLFALALVVLAADGVVFALVAIHYAGWVTVPVGIATCATALKLLFSTANIIDAYLMAYECDSALDLVCDVMADTARADETNSNPTAAGIRTHITDAARTMGNSRATTVLVAAARSGGSGVMTAVRGFVLRAVGREPQPPPPSRAKLAHDE